ncbi:MAG: GIY-YIG nuclease family protein [Brevinema sp.]
MSDNEKNDLWYVYILECLNGSLYTGIAKNVEQRFAVHLSGKGAKYTKIYPPKKILYKEESPSHSDALKRERAIKKMPRLQKLRLIQSNE